MRTVSTADFSLADVDPDGSPGATRADAERESAERAEELADLQERLYASSRFGGTRSVLLLLQAMDTAGKGGIIRHVVGGVDPQGIELAAFKAPTEEELAHDFLWRIEKRVPRPGMIGVVGTMLGEAGINIADMDVGRAAQTGSALMVISTTEPTPPGVLERMRAVPGIISVHPLTGE